MIPAFNQLAVHSRVQSDPSDFHGLWTLGIPWSFCNQFSNEGVWLSCSEMLWFKASRVSVVVFHYFIPQNFCFPKQPFVTLRDRSTHWSLGDRGEQNPGGACLFPVSSPRGIPEYHKGYTRGAQKAQRVPIARWIDTLVSSRKVLCFLTLLTSDRHTGILPFTSWESSTKWLQTLEPNAIVFNSICECC